VREKERYKYVRVGTTPVQPLRVSWGSSGANLEHCWVLSMHKEVIRNRNVCTPAQANPKYPITDWMNDHSFQLILAATEGSETIPRIEKAVSEIMPTRIEPSAHL
jgi:hypothetical protein